MESKASIRTYINTVRNYMKKVGTEDLKKPEELRNSETVETFTSPSTGIEFVLIPADDFKMSSRSKEEDRFPEGCHAHTITIRNSFYLSKFPVTQKQWKQIIRKNPSHFRGENLPVETVSWNEVQKFVKKLNEKEHTDKYRLPLDAEWECACSAGTQTRYFFGNDESKLNEYAWYAVNSGGQTHPVGQKKQNQWGLYDMYGNVWEWVQDKWRENYSSSSSADSAYEDENCSQRVSRGGSWYCAAALCHSASRFRRDSENRFSNLGFRLLREV